MDVIFDILVVLIAAKAAAEIADRIGIPAVAGEIAAGLIIGPSLLGLVEVNEVLRTLAELGVILLLLEVGMEMDLAELRKVGKSSLLVAVIGVAVPFATGYVVIAMFEGVGTEALFVGAALTATSVGITARVFGDLRALATVEARTVLGAAVADDVIGLVILTVVVRIATQGSVSLGSLLLVIGSALGFLFVAIPVGRIIAPPIFSVVSRQSRSAGTLVAIALAFTLGLAELAQLANLAPIIGAFVAGLALTNTQQSTKIRNELAPLGHIFIPVFFLQIGIDADIKAFTEPKALLIGGVLLIVAILGKLVAAAGMVGSIGDKMLVGIGMIPRGEVGLIFATLGLREKIFGEEIYAALLIVVLLTTVITPPWLRSRYTSLHRTRRASEIGITDDAETATGLGKYAIVNGMVTIEREPEESSALAGALNAARLCDDHTPSDSLMKWMTELPTGVRRMDADAQREYLAVLRSGGPSAWRTLLITGVLARTTPEIAELLEHRMQVAFDPLNATQLATLDAVRNSSAIATNEHADALLVAALALDATDESGMSTVAIARRTAARLGLDVDQQEIAATLARDVRLLDASARRTDALDEQTVMQLALHSGSTAYVRGLQALTLAHTGALLHDARRIEALADAIAEVLHRPDLASGAQAECDRRIGLASIGLPDDIAQRLRTAPPSFVLANDTETLREIALLAQPPIGKNDVRANVASTDVDHTVVFTARDRVGLIARETRALLEASCSVLSASAVTWPDGIAVATYRVESPNPPSAERIAQAVRDSIVAPLTVVPLPGATTVFDNESSPWWTRCRVEATDRDGFLHRVTSAFAAANINVHSASVSTVDGHAVDEFEVSDAKGNKLDVKTQLRLETILEHGTAVRVQKARNRKSSR